MAAVAVTEAREMSVIPGLACRMSYMANFLRAEKTQWSGLASFLRRGAYLHESLTKRDSGICP